MAKQHIARKRFGQNFLHDQSVIDDIVHSFNLDQNDHFVEIGPGQGAITEQLAGHCHRLDLIELDRDLIPNLQQRFGTINNLHIHQQDALKFNYQDIYDQQKLRLVGNLPYNISTPLIFHLFDSIDLIADLHFMLQKEVVERMCAQAGTKAYGRLSIMTQYFCDAHMLFLVPPEAFNPQPKVESAIVSLTPKAAPHQVDLELLNKIVTAAFNLRRKTLRNALKSFLDIQDIEYLNLDPKARPENLTLQDYLQITAWVSEKNL